MKPNRPKSRTRRRFLLGGLAATGALIVGWGIYPVRQRLHTSDPLPVSGGAVAFNGWVAIAPDGMVSVTMPRAEMGQGVHTALPMLVAEELDAPLAATRLTQAPIDKIYSNVALLREVLPLHPDEPGRMKDGVQWVLAKVARELGIMFTGGSTSVKDAWEPMREAGAMARAMLVAAAAQRWKVPPGECTTADGFVAHGSGRRAAYGDLVHAAAAMTIKPEDLRLKDPSEFKLIGQPVARRDSPSKVTGAAAFGIDARPQGMLYAAVAMAPSVGATVAAVDDAKARAMPGVLDVVDFSAALSQPCGAGAGVAVIAKSWWQAHQAVPALSVSWKEGEAAHLSSEDVFRQFGQVLDESSGFTYHSRGDMDAAEQAARTVQAEYRAPYLAHATMEPINCTAQVKDGKVRLWVSTQVPSVAVDAAARVGGVAHDQVELHMLFLGGGFGRRLECDMVEQAVAIALRAKGAPVQVIWSREDDITHDAYRPAALARFKAALDANGKLVAWESHSVSASIGHQYYPRALRMPGLGPDKTAAEGLYDMQYEIPNQKIGHVISESPVPVGYWRSVGHSHNAFFKEAFLDEVAHAADQDPVELRRALLAGHPRQLAVLNAAVAKAGPPPPGRAHGVAMHQSFGSVVAEVAEVSVEGKTIRVHRVVCAIDCGLVVNPNIVRQQMESGVIFALSAVLAGEATFKDGRVQQSNFHDYPVVRIGEAPEVETIIMPSSAPPEGVGEPGVPPLAPAVAQAVFKLTGQRLRALPLRLA